MGMGPRRSNCDSSVSLRLEGQSRRIPAAAQVFHSVLIEEVPCH